MVVAVQLRNYGEACNALTDCAHGIALVLAGGNPLQMLAYSSAVVLLWA